MGWNNKEKEKKYNEKYFPRWYEKNREGCIIRAREWRLANKERMKEHRKNWLIRNPWFKHYHAADQRCKRGKYKGKGIKMLMTTKEFKELWLRDKAWELKSPSIDRVDPGGNYEKGNCRFIERSLNCGRASKERHKKNREKRI